MTIRWLPAVAGAAPTAAELAAGRDLAPFIDLRVINPSLVLSEATALDVLAHQTGWRVAGHEYGVVLRGPVVADCSDLAMDAVRALERNGWEMPWDHWHDEHGEVEAWHGPLTLMSPGVAAAQRLVRDLATALFQELLVDMVKTWRGKAGRADRIAYRRRQLARRRRSRR